MISRDKYWIRISKKGSDKRKYLAGQWICFGDKKNLHGLQDELDKYVENEEITLILIALKEEGIDKFPNKPCVLCAFTSNNKLEKETVRSILEAKFSLKIERWKSNWESIKDWNENGLLKIESNIIQLKSKSIISIHELSNLASQIISYIQQNQNPEFSDYCSKERFLNHLEQIGSQQGNPNQSIIQLSNIFDRICIFIWNSFKVEEYSGLEQKIDELKIKQEKQLLYITTKLPDKQFLQQSIGDVNTETVQDIISWLNEAFQNQTIRNLENFIELEEIFNELKESSDWETKLKLSVPLINLIGIEIGVEGKFNLKKHLANIKEEIEKLLI